MRKMPEKRKINSFAKIIINKFEILQNKNPIKCVKIVNEMKKLKKYR